MVQSLFNDKTGKSTTNAGVFILTYGQKCGLYGGIAGQGVPS